MKKRRWLAMAMAVVMTASSIPAGSFTAFAAEEFADVIEEESALLTDDNMDLTVDEAADPFLEDIEEDALPELLSAGDEAETEDAVIFDEKLEEDLADEILFVDEEEAADEDNAADAEYENEEFAPDQIMDLNMELSEAEEVLEDGFFIEEDLD